MSLGLIKCNNCRKVFKPVNRRIIYCSKKCGYISKRRSGRPSPKIIMDLYKELKSWRAVSKLLGKHRYTLYRWISGTYKIK